MSEPKCGDATQWTSTPPISTLATVPSPRVGFQRPLRPQPPGALEDGRVAGDTIPRIETIPAEVQVALVQDPELVARPRDPGDGAVVAEQHVDVDGQLHHHYYKTGLTEAL